MNTVAWEADDDDVTGTEATVVPHRSTKDTKRWCKGHAGREHRPEVVIPQNTSSWAPGTTCRANTWSGSGWLCYHAVVCSACGKHLRSWGFLEPEECPDYDDAAAQAAVASRNERP